MAVNEDSSDSETTPSPPSSEHEAADDTDSEPETDEILENTSTRRNSSTRDDMLDRKETSEHEGPGPVAPTSPMRGLPLHQMQPPPQYHPPPGTTPPTTPQRQEARPGITLRSGLERTNYEEAIQIAQRMKAKRAKRRQQAKQQSSDT